MRNVSKVAVFILWAFMFSGILNGQAKPTPAEALSFLNFYFNGQGTGAILADMKICTEVKENMPVDIIAPDSLKKNEKYILWMMYVVPKDDKVEGIIIQFNQGGITRFTKNASVSGSIRYRTWRSFSLKHTGEWETRVLYDDNGTIEELNKIKLIVRD